MGRGRHRFSDLYLESYLVISFFFSFAYGKAEFTQKLHGDIYVIKGQTAKFAWDYTVDERDDEFVTSSPVWYFKDHQSKSHIIAYDNRYTGWKFQISNITCPIRLKKPVVRVSKESTATLVINDVTTVDNGIYGCKLALKFATDITNEVNLIVTETPKFKDKPKSSTIVIENTDLKIICSATGPPQPNVTWVEISGGNTVFKEQGIGSVMLTVNGIERGSQGRKFMCLARNNPSQHPVNVTTTITVHYPPEIKKKFEQESYCIGDTAKLTCKAVGNPEPSIAWTNPSGQKVAPGDLKIENDKQFGNYTCLAKNIVGSDSFVLRLVKTNVTCQPPVTKPTPSPTTDGVHPGIIAGVVIAAILAIVGLIIAIIFWRRRKLDYTKDSQNRNERSVQMNALADDDNVYATAQHTNRQAPVHAEPTLQYAVVDKSKKTKKKIPGEGELIYADLDHEAPPDERPPSDRRSTGASGEQPTLYADISSTRQEMPRYGNLQDMDHM